MPSSAYSAFVCCTFTSQNRTRSNIPMDRQLPYGDYKQCLGRKLTKIEMCGDINGYGYSMYVCMYLCMHACMHECMHACMHACMYVCMEMVSR